MPRRFTECVRRGGKVRTVTPKPGRYLRVCKLPGARKMIAGHVKRNKSK